MEFSLTTEETRVLGALLEKKLTTPEYYPLSLNALVNACNQKVNRSPVVNYDEAIVQQAIRGLRQKSLIWINTSGRVDKYREGLVEKLELSPDQEAILCVLLLRGPQTPGELRGRCERMHSFVDLEAVQTTLDTLGDMSLAQQAPRQPGQKEQRFCHLLAPIPDVHDNEMTGPADDTDQATSAPDRITLLEEKVESVADQLNQLKQAFDQFRQQFE